MFDHELPLRPSIPFERPNAEILPGRVTRNEINRMRTYFRVLGPLHIEVAGADNTPSAQKLRTVLAMLLMSPNSVLAGDAVAEELWGARPPASARNTLQSYIVHLRHCLEADDTARIETKSYGYKLVVDPRSVDITEFREDIAAAYSAVRRKAARARRRRVSSVTCPSFSSSVRTSL